MYEHPTEMLDRHSSRLICCRALVLGHCSTIRTWMWVRVVMQLAEPLSKGSYKMSITNSLFQKSQSGCTRGSFTR